jgi:hypothetical protein
LHRFVNDRSSAKIVAGTCANFEATTLEVGANTLAATVSVAWRAISIPPADDALLHRTSFSRSASGLGHLRRIKGGRAMSAPHRIAPVLGHGGSCCYRIGARLVDVLKGIERRVRQGRFGSSDRGQPAMK